MGHRDQPLRPGTDCPTCGSLLFPHCPDKVWPAGCDWVRCPKCGSVGTEKRWSSGVSDSQLDDD